MSHPVSPGVPSDDVLGDGVFRAVLEGYDAVTTAAVRRSQGRAEVWSAGSKHHSAALKLAPGVRLIYGVRPAKKKRRQRTAAATAFQVIRATALTSAGRDPRKQARQRPAQPGSRGAAGQLRNLHAEAASPGHHDSFASCR